MKLIPYKKKPTKTSVAEIRKAMEYYERLVLYKTGGRMNLSSPGYEPIVRRPRETFVNYVIRVHREGFRSMNPRLLPRHRLRRNVKLY